MKGTSISWEDRALSTGVLNCASTPPEEGVEVSTEFVLEEGGTQRVNQCRTHPHRAPRLARLDAHASIEDVLDPPG